jgi:hypothetical protein
MYYEIVTFFFFFFFFENELLSKQPHQFSNVAEPHMLVETLACS